MLNLHEPVLLQLSLLGVHDHVLEPGRGLVVDARLDLLQLILGDLRASLLSCEFGNRDVSGDAGRVIERGRKFNLEGRDRTRCVGGVVTMGNHQAVRTLSHFMYGVGSAGAELFAPPPVPPFTLMASVKLRSRGASLAFTWKRLEIFSRWRPIF